MNRTQMLKLRNVEVDVTGAVRVYRANGAMLMRLNRQSAARATQEAIERRTAGQHEVALALTLVGLVDLVKLLDQERELVHKIYRHRRAGLDFAHMQPRREALRRIIDGRAAEADIELAR